MLNPQSPLNVVEMAPPDDLVVVGGLEVVLVGG